MEYLKACIFVAGQDVDYVEMPPPSTTLVNSTLVASASQPPQLCVGCRARDGSLPSFPLLVLDHNI
jgi:hypothetical protein